MHPAFEVEERVKAYVEHALSLDELRRWSREAAGALWSLPVGSRGLELATAMQLCFIEFDGGGFSERQIRSYLKKTLGSAIRLVVEADPVLTTSASDTIFAYGQEDVNAGGATIIGYQLIPTGTTS
jgi:hypothetical protein